IHQGGVWTYIQQRLNISTGLSYSRPLEEFTNRIEKHYGHALRILANGKCPKGRNGHQQKLGKEIPFFNTIPSFDHHWPSHWEIRYGIPTNSDPTCKKDQWQKMIHYKTYNQ